MEAPAKLPVLYVREEDVRRRKEQKEQKLLDAALIILHDGCPPDPKQYLCMGECEDDETACTRCWEEYLLRIMNS